MIGLPKGTCNTVDSSDACQMLPEIKSAGIFDCLTSKNLPFILRL